MFDSGILMKIRDSILEIMRDRVVNRFSCKLKCFETLDIYFRNVNE